MRPVWIKAIVLVAAVWLIAGGVMWWARATKPSPESLAAYVNQHPLVGQSARDREKIVDKAVGQLNALSYEERQAVQRSRTLRPLFEALTPEEQGRFLDATLPQGFKQMMDSLNQMKPADRKKLVEKTLAQMRQQEDGEIPDDARERFQQDRHADKIIDQGLKSFYSEASAETKLDVAPILEQMHRNLQQIR